MTPEIWARASAAVEKEKREIREAGNAVENLWRHGHTFPGYDIKATLEDTTFTEILDTGEEGRVLRANHIIIPSLPIAYYLTEVTRPENELLRDGGSEPIRKSTDNYHQNPHIDFDPLALLQRMRAAAQSVETPKSE